MLISASRIALRHLLAEGPPEHWDEFIKARYQGGKKKVTNTNPKTKDRYPQVTMQTLFNSDESFKKKVMEEYEAWVEKGGDTEAKPSTKVQHPLDTPLRDKGKDEKPVDLFYSTALTKKLRRNQTQQEVEIRKHGHMIGLAFYESLPEEKRKQYLQVMERWRLNFKSDILAYAEQDPDKKIKGHPRFGPLDEAREFLQAWFKKQGITHLTLYRGVAGQGLNHEPPKDGSEVDLDVYAASSWTLDPDVTTTFGSRVVEARVPVEDIMFCPLNYPGFAGQERRTTFEPVKEDEYFENEFIVASKGRKVKGVVRGKPYPPRFGFNLTTGT